MKWRNSKFYKSWRRQTIDRDKQCVICDSNDNLEAHHIYHSTYYINKRYKLDNGITLCDKCHSQFHNNFKNSCREKCDKKDFNNFLRLSFYYKNIFSNKSR